MPSKYAATMENKDIIGRDYEKNIIGNYMKKRQRGNLWPSMSTNMARTFHAK